MPVLRNKATGLRIGTISEADMQFLIDQLEEESTEDADYYVDAATVDMLEEDGGSAELIAMLRQALDGRESIDIEWSTT